MSAGKLQSRFAPSHRVTVEAGNAPVADHEVRGNRRPVPRFCHDPMTQRITFVMRLCRGEPRLSLRPLRTLLHPPGRQTNQALLAVLLITFGTGVATIAIGSPDGAWVAIGHGILGKLLHRGPGAQSVLVHSVTGYWVRFPIDDLDRLLLATQVGGGPLSADHGFPARLVAPGRRGYWWVKWVDRIEVQTTPSWWQPLFPTG